MASDAEVSNGFVKNGTSLPYVIETNQSGTVDCHSIENTEFLHYFLYRQQKTLPKAASCVRNMRKAVCVHDHHEETPGHPHWGETIQLQNLRQAVYSEG